MTSQILSPQKNNPSIIMDRPTFLQKLFNYTLNSLQNSREPLGWNWGSGLMGHAILGYYERTKNEEAWEFLQKWTDENIDQNTSIFDPGGHLWKIGVGTTILALAKKTGDEKYFLKLEEIIDYIFKTPRLKTGAFTSMLGKNEVWIDSLMTLCPTLAWIGQWMKRSDWVNEAAEQIILYSKVLKNPKTHLWYHAYNADNRKALGHYWSRGNGWALFALVEILQVLPIKHPKRKNLLKLLEETTLRLLELQNPAGHWSTILDRPDSFTETSGQALLVYTLAKAIRTHLYTKKLEPKIKQTALKGWKVLVTHITDQGNITGVSLGTGVGNFENYNERPTASWPLWGRAAFLLAAIEYPSEK